MNYSDDDEPLEVVRIGARLILNAAPTEAGSILAANMGLELKAGEDLIGAMARLKQVGRAHLEAYFQALADGNGIADSHLLAQPTSGPTQ
jgi:hypothetical protein